jgi:hypothetical protein
MEGPLIRTFPRMVENNPIEISNGDTTKRLSQVEGNLSAGGLFARVSELPVGTHVVVKISGPAPVELEGVVRRTKPDEVGIEFVGVSKAGRESLNQHIADLTLKGLPAA